MGTSIGSSSKTASSVAVYLSVCVCEREGALAGLRSFMSSSRRRRCRLAMSAANRSACRHVRKEKGQPSPADYFWNVHSPSDSDIGVHYTCTACRLVWLRVHAVHVHTCVWFGASSAGRTTPEAFGADPNHGVCCLNLCKLPMSGNVLCGAAHFIRKKCPQAFEFGARNESRSKLVRLFFFTSISVIFLLRSNSSNEFQS